MQRPRGSVGIFDAKAFAVGLLKIRKNDLLNRSAARVEQHLQMKRRGVAAHADQFARVGLLDNLFLSLGRDEGFEVGTRGQCTERSAKASKHVWELSPLLVTNCEFDIRVDRCDRRSTDEK